MRFPHAFSFLGAFALSIFFCAVMRGTSAQTLPSNPALLDAQNPVYNPGKLPPSTNTTWTFKTSTDNAVATLLVSSEGTTVGATPDGFAQVQVNAQDEVPNPPGRPVGSNMNGYLRVMSKTFNHGTCLGTMCPDMTELSSNNDLRLTAAGKGQLSLVENNTVKLLLDNDGGLKAYTSLEIVMPSIESSVNRGNGQTALRVLPSNSNGPDYGIAIDAERGVEFPFAVRIGGQTLLTACGDGGVIVGLDCTQSRGAGTVNLAGDLYLRGSAYRNPDYVFERFYTGRMLDTRDNPGAAGYEGLRALADLEAFTRARRQLPGIDRAHGVFERQDALLASLEEAYLYIFQLQRQIAQLNTRLTALEVPGK